MIRAGSLTYAIFLALVTAILCSMMILVAFMNRTFFARMDRPEIVKDNAYSGLALGRANLPREDTEEWLDLYGEGSDSVLLKNRIWGCYSVVSSRAVGRGSTFQKTALCGYYSELTDHTALWLADQNRPLQMAGDALLKGTCYLPKKGVDRAYVEGTSYSREKLVYGPTKSSKTHINPLQDGFSQYWEGYFKKQLTSQDSLVGFGSLPEVLDHPFEKKTIVAHSNEAMSLAGFQLSGNIILISENSIRVPANAQLKGVVLLAPEVRVEKDLWGCLHIVATDTVTLGEKVFLKYPSSVLIMPSPLKRGHFLMEKDSRIYGSLISLEGQQGRTNDLAAEIRSGARVKGLVYCEGNLELNGAVEGTVMVNKLLLSTPSGIYENHLLHGRIDRSLLPSSFATVALEKEENKNRIATWY